MHHAYHRHAVLRGVDLRLRAGTLCGMVGENGAGKSTLLKVLSGELQPTRGRVRHNGRFGYCPQRVVLNDALTVRQAPAPGDRVHRCEPHILVTLTVRPPHTSGFRSRSPGRRRAIATRYDYAESCRAAVTHLKGSREKSGTWT